MRRRQWVKTVLAALAVVGGSRRRDSLAAPVEVKLADDSPVQVFDFEAGGIEGWTTVAGQWVVEEMADAPSGKKVLVQRATKNEFNVTVAPGSYADVDVSIKFRPISGREDASGGIIVRFNDGRYYVVRANALEDNFRLYSYDRGRRQLATARVKPRRWASGIPCASWPSATTCRPGSTARSIWTIATRGSRQGVSACGPRPTRSRRSMTSRSGGKPGG